MSLRARLKTYMRGSFPRVSGDEPPSSLASVGSTRFSPRERG